MSEMRQVALQSMLNKLKHKSMKKFITIVTQMNTIITNTSGKTWLVSAGLLLFAPFLLSAQDKISKINGERITAQIAKDNEAAERQNNEQKSNEERGAQISFSLNKRGEFYRQDSDKNYYVIEYDGLSKDEIEAKYKKSIEFFNQMPSYFEMPTFVLSSEKKLDATWTVPGWSMNALIFRLTARVDFKDGKMRIDAPTLKVSPRQSSGEYFPDEFIAAEPRNSKHREEMCMYIANAVLNMVILSISSDLHLWEDFDVSDEIVTPKKQYFTLSTGGEFKYANGKNVMGFKIPGIKKEKIREALIIAVNSKDRNSQSVLGVQAYPNVSQYDDDMSIQVDVIKDIKLSQSILGDILFGEKEELSISFSYVYSCFDGEVLVSVPIVTSAKCNNNIFEGPEDYLHKLGFANRNGDIKKIAQDNIDRINAFFNMIVMLPVWQIQDVALTPQKYNQNDQNDW